jgi:hypothetical protein
MGTSNGSEQGQVYFSGNFAGTGQSANNPIKGYFNVFLTTFTGSVNVERSPDGGTTWYIFAKDTSNTPATYTAGPVSLVLFEPEAGILYRLNMTALSAGSPNYRVSGPAYGSNMGVAGVMF